MVYCALYLLTFLVTAVFSQQDRPCYQHLTEDITNGQRLPSGAILKNNVRYDSDNYYIDNDRIWGCICNIKSCVRYCCDVDEVYVNETCRKEKTHSELNISVYQGTKRLRDFSLREFSLIKSLTCPKLHARISAGESDLIYIQENGLLYYVSGEYKAMYDPGYYCLTRKADNTLLTILCESYEDEGTTTTYAIGMITSLPFLVMSFVVFAIIPKSNLYKKALMGYVLTLFFAYTFLLIVQLFPGKIDENFVCPALGYLIIFFFMSSFFWMNVVCLDIWFAFRDMSDFNGRKLAERKGFLMYFAYAVGVPSLHFLVIFLINTFGASDSFYFPGVGYEKCFLRDGCPNLLYFYGPIVIVVTVNVTLFILTAVRIQRVVKETSILRQYDSKRHFYKGDQQKFNLYVTMLFVVGIHWIMEIITWAIDWYAKSIPSYVWYLTDFSNIMYTLIFFIFFFKQNIWRFLRKRYNKFIEKNPKQLGPVTTPPQKLASTTTVEVNSTKEEERKECCLKIKMCFTQPSCIPKKVKMLNVADIPITLDYRPNPNHHGYNRAVNMKVLLALSFAVLNIASDNSAAEDVIDLCSNFSNYESYTKNITQNCGCEKTRPCIRKCCQKGFYLQHYEDAFENVFESVCIKKESHSFNVPICSRRENIYNLTVEDNFMIGMLDCKNDDWQYFKINNSDITERVYIQENGSLYYPASRYKIYDSSRYCVDEEDGLTVFLCYTNTKPSVYVSRIVNSVGMIISMPFLVLTFLVFAMVPNASVHRKVIMFYSLSLFLAYVFLVIVQLYPGYIEPVPCQTIGYSIIFFFMASIFWMNIMCFDTWFAFGGLANFTRETKSERRRFIIYFIYAWGLPLIHVFLVFIFNTFGDPNSPYYPGVGRSKCFLEDGLRSTFAYFYGPITVIIGLNIILFILTAIKIHKIKKDTIGFQHCTKRSSYEYDKQKFHLYLKLLLAMGINWSLEIVSWAVEMRQAERDPHADTFFIWYISDFCNAIYGLIIFLIFVYRKEVWRSFKKRVVILAAPCCNKSYEVEKLKKSQEDGTTSVTDGRDIYF
ncbi:uncharacterized protein LOC108907922 [Anoplophora glabripennis]|uniref:uncharacterized protein LOC108907922 n=1 Tax=Anoplophora glabripennis TaxID=217634 RepID=UPI0008740718|nr:uncharacterized protein LOC108907922 [Anoplophora glabripennis]